MLTVVVDGFSNTTFGSPVLNSTENVSVFSVTKSLVMTIFKHWGCVAVTGWKTRCSAVTVTKSSTTEINKALMVIDIYYLTVEALQIESCLVLFH